MRSAFCWRASHSGSKSDRFPDCGGGMKVRTVWPVYLRRALAASCVPTRNWRWMLASFGIGAGFGLIGGLHRLGKEPARLSQDVAVSALRGAVLLFVVVWLVIVTMRFGRLLWAHRRGPV
jgi:hypothetical protein